MPDETVLRPTAVSPYQLPSDTIDQLWISVADSYSVASLAPLFTRVTALFHDYARTQGTPLDVYRASVALMAAAARFEGVCPDADLYPAVRYAYDRDDSERSWLSVQRAVQGVVTAWRVIGL